MNDISKYLTERRTQHLAAVQNPSDETINRHCTASHEDICSKVHSYHKHTIQIIYTHNIKARLVFEIQLYKECNYRHKSDMTLRASLTL